MEYNIFICQMVLNCMLTNHYKHNIKIILTTTYGVYNEDPPIIINFIILLE